MDDDDYYYSMSGGSEEEEEEDSSDQEDDSIYGIADEDSDVQSRVPYSTIITRESLLAAQIEPLQRVMDILSLKKHHARALLIQYRWDVDQLISVYVESGKAYMFAEAGVTVAEHVDLDPPKASSTVMCYVCMDDVMEKDMTRMDCSHSYCNNCWAEHFIVKIKEGLSRRIKCMAHKCNGICDEDVIKRVVSERDPDLAKKFDRFLLESYIEDNEMVKWCPSVPHCGNAIRVENDKFCEVECSCGLQFCFSCGSEAHSPCSCLMWEMWAKKCSDESETVNWITVHTKPCPKCSKPVEKNGGCNLVACICGQAFCWLCGGATGRSHTWTTIDNHSCGRYKDDDTVEKAELAKRYLYRYMHYHGRYKAHKDSFKQESGLRETIKEKIATLEERDSQLRDFSWVTNGLYRLFRSRRALSYSYAFAFYMFGDELFKNEMTEKDREMKKNLFEDQQQQLESKVEILSKFLEEPFDEFSVEKVMDNRMLIINLSSAIDNLCKGMYECIENDLLNSTTQMIAPYQSKGIEKAVEFATAGPDAQEATSNDEYRKTDDLFNETDQASTSGTLDDSIKLSRKRHRKGIC